MSGRPFRLTVKRPRDSSQGYSLAIIEYGERAFPLAAIGDMHWGAPTFDQRALESTRKWIADNDSAWVGMGDWIENANSRSVGAGWAEQVSPPQTQMREVAEFLEPIAHLCVGAVRGNHEIRTWKDCGIDPMSWICGELEIPYFTEEFYGMFSAPRLGAVSLYAAHSTTASKTPGLSMNVLERDVAKWAHTDIIAKAHSHDTDYQVREWIEVDKGNHNVRRVRGYYWLTGHYLGRPDSYIARRMAGPKPLGTVALRVKILGHRMTHVVPEYIMENGGRQ